MAATNKRCLESVHKTSKTNQIDRHWKLHKCDELRKMTPSDSSDDMQGNGSNSLLGSVSGLTAGRKHDYNNTPIIALVIATFAVAVVLVLCVLWLWVSQYRQEKQLEDSDEEKGDGK